MALLDWIELSDDDEGTVKEKLPPEKVKELPLNLVQEEQNAHVHCHAAWLEVEIIDLTTEDVVEEDRNAHGNGDSAQWGTTSHMQQFVAPHGQDDAAQTVFPKQEYLASADDVEEFLIAGDVAQETMQSGNQDFAAAVGRAEEATHSENAAEAGPSSFTEQGVEASDCGEETRQPGNQDFATAVDCAEEATHSENAAEAGPSSSTEQGVAASNHDEEVMQPGNPDFATAVDSAEEAMQSENVSEAGPSSFTEQVVVAGDRGEEAMQPGNPYFAAPVDCAEEAMQSENTAEAGPSLFTEQVVVAGDHSEEAMQPGNPDFAAAVDCAEESTQSENAAEAGPSSFTEQVVVAGGCSEEAMRSGNQVFDAAADCAEETMQSENAAEAGPSSFTEQGVAASNCGEEAMQPGNQDFAAAVDCAEEATHSENAVEAAPSSFTEQGVVASDRGEETMQPGNPDFAAAVDCAEEAMQSGNATGAGPSSSTEQVVVAGDCSEEAMPSGNQVLDAAVDCAEEAMQSENAAEAGPLLFTGQGVVASDCGEETMQSGKQYFVAAVDCAEEAMQSENVVEAAPSSFTEGLAAGDFAKEAMQYKHADKAAECSPMTGQAAASSLSMTEQGTTTSSLRTAQQSHKRDALLGSPPISTAAPFPRQFWKAGEFKVAAQASINSGQNCLRINPKFLHSNATSHKWVFGAIAELLDNAVDEVQNGATYVKIDKMKYSPVGEYSLMIQDDGGGMSPEYLRHCLSFGFSNKCTNSSIGQYGNGFKTSTMRLGADAIIFSCRKDNSRLTRSVGLLSYTFLMKTGCDDILVPVVDYEFDPSSCNFKRIMDRGENHFSSNLSALLRWSPFSTEDDLLNQFEDMGCHGTKIIVFNLWLNDASEMELDFTTDDEDIMISGAPKIPEERRKFKRLYHMHIANRFRYSLRVYASILYLHLPEHFKVILCGQVVEPHHIIKDLIYRECIKYRPHVGVSAQVDVVTSIGFLKGAPNLDIYGFNIYHRNRLILPFWAAGSERGRGRGIAGVLEANFIRPTHDKQDFEKTELFQRLETRLKDMTMEYWKYHAHLIGYQQVRKNIPSAYYAPIAATNDNSSVAQAVTTVYARNSRAKASGVLDSRSNGGNSLNPLHVGASRDQMDYGACSLMRNMRTSLYRPSTPQQTEPCKRRNSGSMIESRAQKRQNTNGDADHLGSVNVVEILDERSRVLICQKNMLKAECSELEAAGKNLQNEADRLLNELREWQRKLRSHADELKFYDGLCAIQRRIPIGNTSSMGVGWI